MLTTSEVAKILKLSPDTIRAKILRGELPALNLAEPGRRPQYRVTDEQLSEYQRRVTILQPIRTGRPRRLV